MQMLKIGIIGIGRQGSIHLEYLQNSNLFELLGCYDKNVEKLQRIQEDYNVSVFDNIEDLLDAVDIVCIATPAHSHYYYAEKALKKSKHVFIESPISEDLVESQRIIELSREANVKVQIGHIDRFNPVFRKLKEMLPQPQIIETYRTGIVNPKKDQTSVVFELMIHDIDLVLNLVKANIKYIHATGVAVMSNIPDTVHARIEFDNGCVAQLNASRSTSQRSRNIHLLENGRKISLDLIKRNIESITLEDENVHGAIPTEIKGEKKYIVQKLVTTSEYDSMKKQMESFALSIYENTIPEVCVEHGNKALEVANIILEKVNKWELA